MPPPPPSRGREPGNTVNERAVRILLECILVGVPWECSTPPPPRPPRPHTHPRPSACWDTHTLGPSAYWDTHPPVRNVQKFCVNNE